MIEDKLEEDDGCLCGLTGVGIGLVMTTGVCGRGGVETTGLRKCSLLAEDLVTLLSRLFSSLRTFWMAVKGMSGLGR